MAFLEKIDFTRRSFSLNINGLTADGLFIGKGNLALEVAIFTSSTKPSDSKVLEAFKKRRAGRASESLLLYRLSVTALLAERVAVC